MLQDQLLQIPSSDKITSLRFAERCDVFRNLPYPSLIAEALKNKEGRLTDKGALAVTTGRFTGRSPEDKYIVKDELTEHSVHWGKINNPFDSSRFDALYDKMLDFISDKTLFICDCYGGASPEFRLRLEVVTTKAWQGLFALNQFIKPSQKELGGFLPEWSIISIPEFEANPDTDGTKSANFSIINFSKKLVLIGGTEYAGEIKKSLFTVLNYLLPVNHNVLPMHCSATAGQKGDVALFFGLSGTGKTTLSADPNRCLIGDDEHGWGDNVIFNFEGGCYAKVIKLNAGHEPGIFEAIRYGALLENVCFEPGTSTVNYDDDSLTENTRASYPLSYAGNNTCPLVNSVPRNIFFLTADAFGVLPPIASLDKAQAKAFFLTGYTSKLAGTEVGIIQPKPTFSACFGAAFLPLHPMQYANLLEAKMEECKAKVWLINTGWTKGPYGTGHRIPIATTRALINAALSGDLNTTSWKSHPVFGVAVPDTFTGLDDQLFETKAGWDDESAYLTTANLLLKDFIKHLATYVGESEAYELLFPSKKIRKKSVVSSQ